MSVSTYSLGIPTGQIERQPSLWLCAPKGFVLVAAFLLSLSLWMIAANAAWALMG